MKCAFLKAARVPLVAAFAMSALPALGADLYGYGAKDAPMDVMPSFWSGFYLGVNGGYAWGAAASQLSASAIENGDLAGGTATKGYWSNGGFGGGQFGYNLQRHNLVFGFETDIQGAGIRGKGAAEAVSLTDQAVTSDAGAKSNLDWFGTLRGRVGYAFGSTLVYATAGLAYGEVRDSLTLSVTSNNALPTQNAPGASKDLTTAGYVVGGGVETSITPSWSVKAEYQFIDLGSSRLSTSKDIPWGVSATDSGSASAKFDHSYNTIRFGLNYKFNQGYEPLK
jgi:outer membrane immunogenic protein